MPDLGAFSISLNVKDIVESKKFYESLGFSEFSGDIESKWIILKNGFTVIGLFEGMFESNILTFNPGWDQNAKNLEKFMDVREIQHHLIKENIQLTSKVDNNTMGPGYITLVDPDGNQILIDQHR